MAENKSPRFFYGYVVVLVSFFILAIMEGTLSTYGVFLKPLSVEFGWSRATISGAYSLLMFLLGLFCIVTGRLNDRFGPRLIMTVCGFFVGLGYLLMSQITAIWQLYLFYGLLVAIGLSGSWVPLLSTVARWFVKRRGLMMGFVFSGGGIGTMVITPIANWLITNYGWRTSYMIIGIIASVLIVLAAQFLRRDPAQMGQLAYGGSEIEEASLDLEAGGFSFREAIHTRQFLMLGAISLLAFFSLAAILVHIVPHAIELGISAASAVTILAIIGGLGVAGRIVMGEVGDKIGNKPALIVCVSLMSAALFWLLAAKEVWMLYLFAAVFGFACGGFNSVGVLIVAGLFGTSSLGMIMGSITFIATIGEAVGPVLAGMVFDITGGYYLAFLTCAIVSMIAIILTLFLTPIADTWR